MGDHERDDRGNEWPKGPTGMTPAEAHNIAIVNLISDMHHALGRIRDTIILAAAFFALGVVVDVWRGDYVSAFFTAVPALFFGLAARETNERRKKYTPRIKEFR